ncbi:MAG: DNA-binding MarR family transcriptional regulator [Pseudorhodobacter sp.]
MNPFNLSEFLPYQLAVAATRVSRDFAAIYQRDAGLSVPEWRVMAHLAQSGAVSVREIHARVDMDKPKVSRAASRLESAGLIHKQSHPTDGRLVQLSLTKQGEAMMQRLIPLAQGFHETLLQSLGADAAVMQRILSKLGEKS